MASKAAAIGVGLGALSLLALVGIAKAKPKPAPSGGDGGTTPAGFGGPNKEQCQAWYNQRVQLINTVSELDKQIADYNAAGWGTPEDLLAARAKAKAQADHLAVLMQECE